MGEGRGGVNDDSEYGRLVLNVGEFEIMRMFFLSSVKSVILDTMVYP